MISLYSLGTRCSGQLITTVRLLKIIYGHFLKGLAAPNLTSSPWMASDYARSIPTLYAKGLRTY